MKKTVIIEAKPREEQYLNIDYGNNDLENENSKIIVSYSLYRLVKIFSSDFFGFQKGCSIECSEASIETIKVSQKDYKLLKCLVMEFGLDLTNIEFGTLLILILRYKYLYLVNAPKMENLNELSDNKKKEMEWETTRENLFIQLALLSKGENKLNAITFHFKSTSVEISSEHANTFLEEHILPTLCENKSTSLDHFRFMANTARVGKQYLKSFKDKSVDRNFINAADNIINKSGKIKPFTVIKFCIWIMIKFAINDIPNKYPNSTELKKLAKKYEKRVKIFDKGLSKMWELQSEDPLLITPKSSKSSIA